MIELPKPLSYHFNFPTLTGVRKFQRFPVNMKKKYVCLETQLRFIQKFNAPRAT